MTDEEFSELLDRYSKMILSKTHKKAASIPGLMPHLEDMRQAVFMRLWRYRDRIISSIATHGESLILTIAVSRAINAFSMREQPQFIVKIPTSRIANRAIDSEELPQSFSFDAENDRGAVSDELRNLESKMDVDLIISRLSQEDREFLKELVYGGTENRDEKIVRTVRYKQAKILNLLKIIYNKEEEY